jgi:hypothetical protein
MTDETAERSANRPTSRPDVAECGAPFETGDDGDLERGGHPLSRISECERTK